MKLYLRHYSPARNRNSILREGLTVSRCKGRMVGIWLAGCGKYRWALYHVAAHQDCHIQNLDCWEVEVESTEIVKRRKGVWIIRRGVPAEKLKLLHKGENKHFYSDYGAPGVPGPC